MRGKIKIHIIIFFVLNSTLSCTSQERKAQAQRDIEIAENLVKQNLSYTPNLNDSNRNGFTKALNYINKAIELEPQNVRAYKDKLTILNNLGITPDPTILIKLLELDPNFAEGYIQLGQIYEKLNKIDSATISYKNARSIYLKKPSNDLRNLNLIVIEFLITNDKNEALNKLQEFPILNTNLKEAVQNDINEIMKSRLR